jgi:PII-like signaling protein
MRVLEGDHVLLRIFIGESDRFGHQPLGSAILERLRKEGLAGATVLHGVAGFGARSVIHSAQILRLSEDLPVVIEAVDTKEQIDRILPILDQMISGEALVTMEKVRVVRYGKRGT